MTAHIEEGANKQLLAVVLKHAHLITMKEVTFDLRFHSMHRL